VNRRNLRIPRVKRYLFKLWRFWLGRARPSKATNTRRLSKRGEDVASLVIREAVASDIPALAALHVATWNATYAPMHMKGPSVAIRESQWREAFANADGSWFCFVVVRDDGELVGLAKGNRHDAIGALDKIYLRDDYQRLGLGRRLVGQVVGRFLVYRCTSMKAYVDPRNPSCGFFEALEGEWLREEDGTINYSWYVWPDLQRVARLCPSI